MFSKSQWIWVFIALAALRLVIGYHFFTEGKSKIDSGNWDASGFFKSSVGPLRPMYLSMLPDYDATQTLCLVPKNESQSVDKKTPSMVRPIEGSDFVLDTRPTIAAWAEFQEKVVRHYGLSKTELDSSKAAAKRKVETLKKEIGLAEKSGDQKLLASLRKSLQETQRYQHRVSIADPYAETFLILARRGDQLHNYLQDNRQEIENFALGKERLDGFAIDGVGGKDAGREVESLRGQIKSIQSDREKVKNEHVQAIQGIWDGLESELNSYGKSLARDGQGDIKSSPTGPSPRLYSPSSVGPDSMIYWINRIVPYFDLVVGILLLAGFFSRLAATAGVIFLLGILATQLPWVPGAVSTFPQWIEAAGLMVIAATGAGRFGGIDGVIAWMFGRRSPSPAEGTSTASSSDSAE